MNWIKRFVYLYICISVSWVQAEPATIVYSSDIPLTKENCESDKVHPKLLIDQFVRLYVENDFSNNVVKPDSNVPVIMSDLSVSIEDPNLIPMAETLQCIMEHAFTGRGNYINVVDLYVNPMMLENKSNPLVFDALSTLLLTLEIRWQKDTFIRRISRDEKSDTLGVLAATGVATAYALTKVARGHLSLSALKELRRSLGRIALRPTFVRMSYSLLGVGSSGVVGTDSLEEINRQLEEDRRSHLARFTGESLTEIWHSPIWWNDRTADNNANEILLFDRYSLRRDIGAISAGILGVYAGYKPLNARVRLPTRVSYGLRKKGFKKRWVKGGSFITGVALGAAVYMGFEGITEWISDLAWERHLQSSFEEAEANLIRIANSIIEEKLDDPREIHGSARASRTVELSKELFNAAYAYKYKAEQLAEYRRGLYQSKMTTTKFNYMDDYICSGLENQRLAADLDELVLAGKSEYTYRNWRMQKLSRPIDKDFTNQALARAHYGDQKLAEIDQQYKELIEELAGENTDVVQQSRSVYERAQKVIRDVAERTNRRFIKLVENELELAKSHNLLQMDTNVFHSNLRTIIQANYYHVMDSKERRDDYFCKWSEKLKEKVIELVD